MSTTREKRNPYQNRVELLQGTLDMLILQTLQWGPQHVNEKFARLLGLGENPIGMRFRREATPMSPEEVNEIVGVVKDTKYSGIRRPAAAIAYLDITQDKDADNSMLGWYVRSCR